MSCVRLPDERSRSGETVDMVNFCINYKWLSRRILFEQFAKVYCNPSMGIHKGIDGNCHVICMVCVDVCCTCCMGSPLPIPRPQCWERLGTHQSPAWKGSVPAFGVPKGQPHQLSHWLLWLVYTGWRQAKPNSANISRSLQCCAQAIVGGLYESLVPQAQQCQRPSDLCVFLSASNTAQFKSIEFRLAQTPVGSM